MADRFVFFVVTNYNVINDALKQSLEMRYLEFKREFQQFDALVSEQRGTQPAQYHLSGECCEPSAAWLCTPGARYA